MELLYDDALAKIAFYLDAPTLLKWRATCKELRANIALREETVARVNWWEVSIGNLPRRVTLQFAVEFADYINWTLFCLNHTLPQSFITANEKIIDLDVIAATTF